MINETEINFLNIGVLEPAFYPLSNGVIRLYLTAQLIELYLHHLSKPQFWPQNLKNLYLVNHLSYRTKNWCGFIYHEYL